MTRGQDEVEHGKIICLVGLDAAYMFSSPAPLVLTLVPERRKGEGSFYSRLREGQLLTHGHLVCKW